MSKRDYLGEFEHIVLLAVLRLGKEAYGVTVRQEIEARTGREVSIGAVYATLDRLEGKGYVQSYAGVTWSLIIRSAKWTLTCSGLVPR